MVDVGDEIVKVTTGGATQYGQAVGFGFQMADGSERRFHCRFERFAKLVQGVRAFGQIAEKARAGMLPTSLEVVDPYQITVPPQAGVSVNGQVIVLAFQTSEGVPVTLSMSRDAAQATISELGKALAQTGPKYDPRS